MFPYDNSEIVFVCPYPDKRKTLALVNTSLTLVIDTSMERFSRVLHHGELKKIDFLLKKLLTESVNLLSCFVNNFQLKLCTLIGAIILSINIHVGLNIYLC